ncbi:malectin domain-containing carbohydrate-binding protein [Opitutus terrae]|uniref:Malectin domain-containing protein n=1 Tax=Opitutus terrae (strain DSM 11246 / JCM 15787 / PB90-1) TaxID=452637 RepID=B1ZPQ9_OPITP|nr:malectin domain-containing carbohydrate-binding protein [Opitutus terrae]ACB75512.1 hypothetical protein Oter_2229 [Opitutus terrae PB90-1]
MPRSRAFFSVRNAWFVAALLVTTAVSTTAAGAPTPRPDSTWTITLDPHASALERFAARELQRYVYVCSGELPKIQSAATAPADHAFVLGIAPQPLLRDGPAGPQLAAQQYRLQAEGSRDVSRIWIVGGDPLGLLYGVYRLAEKLGVRFYLHGDVIPDERALLDFEPFHEEGRPLFSVRGLQPFHDFAEGPDWWNRDDYLAHVGQLAKLRMNFLGLHTYPESQVGPEPTVWIGGPGEFDQHGRVDVAYRASYHTTSRSGQSWWAYAPVPTSEFTGGAAELFDRDDFGGDVMRDASFAAQTPGSAAVVFNRAADLLGTAFAEARRLGVLTCIGTETPLTLPGAVRDRLVRSGRNPDDPATTREIYRAMFDRITRATPVDYYWLWTPETWTWEGNRPEHFAKTAADIEAALAALRDLKNPITLATCGWVLGPQHDRSALDRLLPPASPMSAINSSVGHVAIERAFTNLSERPRWAIPWLENDGNLTSPQLWAGRMRYDAADALRLGCTGLIGIHWRTQILAPQISALAVAAWEQPWIPDDFDATRIPPLTTSGATGGRAVRTDEPIDGERVSGVNPFASNRIGMAAYDLLVPSGSYTVRLGFSEIENAAPGARVFAVKLNGETLINRLDVSATQGKNRALWFEFHDVKITEARLLLEFTPITGEPAIAAIELEGTTTVGNSAFARRINCGGPVHGDFEADELPGRPRPPIDRAMPVREFYRDFARANFGPEAATAIGDLFASIDGVALPMPTQWIDGPGDIRRNPEPWEKVAADYAFVGRLESLRPQVRGSANLARFDYWLNQLRSMRLIAEIGCTAGALDREMSAAGALADVRAAQQRVEKHALPLRIRLATLWTELLRTEIAGASNVGELGTLANLEQRSRVHQRLLEKHDHQLVQLLGYDLPLAAWPTRDYAGPARIIVPTVRTAAPAGESLKIRVLLVSTKPETDGSLRWRWVGEPTYRTVPLRHVARRVYEAELPALGAEHPALEYAIEATLDGASHRWPASDRELGQTVILAESD